LKKFDYKPVKKSKRVDLEKHGQLNLFAPRTREAKVIRMKSDLSPFEQGLLMDEKGDRRAKEFYLQAIREHDYTADAYCNLGIIESKEGNTISAIDCFTTSLMHDPRHLESHFNLANLYFDNNELKLAKLHYQTAARIQSDYPNVYFNLALVHAMLHEFEDAVEALKKYKSLTHVSEHKNADTLLKNLQLSMSAKN
ncbi:MAG TPA: tetratricopeptide repeat protein, partial [Chitinophagales bacterium]|nr:tetratricopeptide repeat protein [Chitinophagales bacterium]